MKNKNNLKPACPDDLPSLMELITRRGVFPGYIGPEDPHITEPLLRKEHLLARNDVWEDPEIYPVLLWIDPDDNKITGFMCADLEVEDELFPRFHSQIYDWLIPPGPPGEKAASDMLSCMEALSMDLQNHQILIDILHDKDKESVVMEKVLKERGYFPLKNRIFRLPRKHDLNTVMQKSYHFREAIPRDRDFILMLASQNCKHLVPPGMEEESARYIQLNYNSYASMDITGDPGQRFFIVEDKSLRQSVGFISLITDVADAISPHKCAYLFDMSVHESYWGKYATHVLVRGADNYLTEHDYTCMYADVLSSNPRALKTAVKSLGFIRHSRQWARKSTLDNS